MVRVERIVNKIFESNTYVISNDGLKDVWLVDVGDTEKVLSILPLHSIVKGVLLTHTHFDHIYGLNTLHSACRDCFVYTSSYGKVALYDEKKNFSKYHESPFVYEGTNVTILKDGDNIELFSGVFITAYETPGHCPSCLTYVLDNWIFTGDAYIPEVKVVTKLPGGDRAIAKQSLERIIGLAEGKIVCAGHGEFESNIKKRQR